jgi:RNA polymerase sigma-70 factor (ECF subfamily)
METHLAQPTAMSIPSDEISGATDERELALRASVDREAFGVLYRRHAGAILNYLKRRTGDTAAAEDLCSETFLRAIVNIHRFRPRDAAFRTWLFRIATNLANSRARGPLRPSFPIPLPDPPH